MTLVLVATERNSKNAVAAARECVFKINSKASFLFLPILFVLLHLIFKGQGACGNGESRKGIACYS